MGTAPFLMRRKSAGVREAPDRRERKKRAVRAALEEAAFRLFDERGFAETTVDLIADEADVSRSTFFRYFGSKEAVLFGSSEENGQILSDLILQRPEGEPPLVAFENAVVAFVAVPGIARAPAYADRFQRILEANPALKAKSAELTHNWRARIAETFARREGDSTPDHAHLLAAAIGIAILERIRDEYIEPGFLGDLEALIEEQFRLLRELAHKD
jgi:AcrR family transcriptional regulator